MELKVDLSYGEQLFIIEHQTSELRRFRHLSTVRRTIREQSGTGGSSAIGVLRQALEHSLFPELCALRDEIPR